MFSHIMIGSNDIARSKKFYDALALVNQAAAAQSVAYRRLVARFDRKTSRNGKIPANPRTA